MNIFGISPGRTATTTLATAFQSVDGYSSGHETLTQRLGEQRVAYPSDHFEFDNRLVWFLPRIHQHFGAKAVLLIVERDREAIAQSYNRRWYRRQMMLAYSSGILLRPEKYRDIEVCRDYVRCVYEHLYAAADSFAYSFVLDVHSPGAGIRAVLELLDRENDIASVNDHLATSFENRNGLGVRASGAILKDGLRHFGFEIGRCLRS